MKILLTTAFILATSPVIVGQTGSTSEWISCTVTKVVKEGKVRTTYHRCPQLERQGRLNELRVVGLEGIPKVVGTQFFLRRAGRCLVAYTTADEDRERFIRHALNVDCDRGRKVSQMLWSPPKKKAKS